MIGYNRAMTNCKGGYHAGKKNFIFCSIFSMAVRLSLYKQKHHYMKQLKRLYMQVKNWLSGKKSFDHRYAIL